MLTINITGIIDGIFIPTLQDSYLYNFFHSTFPTDEKK